jgi:hypothetical protein
MPTFSETLITDVHPQLASDPVALPVIRLQPTVAAMIVVTDAYVEVTLDVSAPVRFVLQDYTLTALVAALPAGLGATLLDAEWATVYAHCLVPNEGLQAIPNTIITLDAYTSILWRLVRPLAQEIADTEVELFDLLEQANLRLADGAWLDTWGLVWDVRRLGGELDTDYRTRMLNSITRPRVSHPSLQSLLTAAFGVKTSVATGAAGAFTVVMYQPTASFNDILAFINKHKAAGCIPALTLVYSPVGTLQFSRLAGSTNY